MFSSMKKLCIFAFCAALSGCVSTTENNVDFKYFIRATANINPDIESRPSPVVVRIFQLTNRINFDNAGYDALFTVDQNVLGNEYISLDEYLTHPDSNNEIELKISENAKFLGVAVGYRSIDNVTWRTVVTVPEGRFWKSSGIEINVDKLSVRALEL